MQFLPLIARAVVRRAFAMAFALALASIVQPATAAQSVSTFGVLVMAHGGSPEWNRGVTEAVEPLRSRYPVEIAFGMADAVTMQDAVRKLEAQGGVREIGVVRLFVSGESWYERTRQILGLAPGAP